MNYFDDYDEPLEWIIECYRCGKCGLHWDSYADQYVLVDTRGMIHKCPTLQPNPDDFDDVS